MPLSKSSSRTKPRKWCSVNNKHLSHLIFMKQISPANHSKATIKRLIKEPQWEGHPYKAFAQLIQGKLEKVETDQILKGGRGFHQKAS